MIASSSLRYPTIICGVLALISFAYCLRYFEFPSESFDNAWSRFKSTNKSGPILESSSAFDPDNLRLSTEQCDTYFPGLYREINDMVARGDIGPIKPVARSGYVTARVFNNELYVVAQGKKVWHRHGATLHAINRALMTSPEPLPNVLLPLQLNDHPSGNMISLARSPAPKEVNQTFLMPDYAFWSWPEPKIGSWTEARVKIAAVDNEEFARKTDQAVWRGTIKFNSKGRGQLVKQTKGKEWADVQELHWGKNDMPIEDFCKYKFLLYAEGVTYSGRLAYFTQCRSIIITTPFKWYQHYTHLFNPTPGSDQNIVFVKPDWSDLEEKIDYLKTHPDEADNIANNLVRTFRDTYLTPAAVNCYWRKLIRGYAKVTMAGREVEIPTRKEMGVRFESFALMGSLDWQKVA